MLIGLSGFMGSGKDEAGKILTRKFNFRRFAFGDAVKDEIQIALASKIIPSGLSQIGCEAFLTCLALGITDPFAKPTSPEMRVLMQQWGTEFRRRQDENYWVKKVQKAWYALNRPAAYVSDVRFFNEMDWVRAEGGYCMLIDGRKKPITIHESEQLPAFRDRFDVIVNNTVDDPGLLMLEHAVTQAYYELLEQKAA
jgi:hypothetical protein